MGPHWEGSSPTVARKVFDNKLGAEAIEEDAGDFTGMGVPGADC